MKKKIILTFTILLFVICISIFAYVKVNNIKKLRADANEPVYRQAGFESEEVYSCIIEEYNRENDGANKTIQDKLDNDEIESITGNFRGDILCKLPENAHNKSIDLKGVDQLNHETKFLIYGTANKLVVRELNNYYFGLFVNADKYEIYKNDLLSFGIGSEDDIYRSYRELGFSTPNVNNIELYNNNFFKDFYFHDDIQTNIKVNNVDNFYIHNNNACDYYDIIQLFISGNINNLIIDKINSIYDYKTIVFVMENDALIKNLTMKDSSAGLFDDGSSLENLMIDNCNFTRTEDSYTPPLSYLGIYSNTLKTLKINNTDLNDIEVTGQLPSADITNNTNLTRLDLSGNKLKSINLSNNVNLERLNLRNNLLTDIDLLSFPNLKFVDLYNNSLTSIDLSTTKATVPLLKKNKFEDNLKYIIKGREYNIRDFINIPGELHYTGDIAAQIKIENDVLVASEEGKTSFIMFKGVNYGELTFNVNIYDITSTDYTIDKEKKVIEYEEEFNKAKVYITNGYTVKVEGDRFIISKEDDYVDKFKLVKKEKTTTKITTSTKKNDNNTDNIISNAITSIKSFMTGNNSNSKQDNNIYINGTYIKSIYLRRIKGYNRNIILNTNNGIIFIVNGLDIKDSTKDIDLEYIFINLDKYAKKEEIKEKIDSGYILKFKTMEDLPFKMMIEVAYDKVKDIIEKDKVNIYKYDGKYQLIINNNGFINNKLSFYIDDTSVFIITNDEIKEKINSNDILYKADVYKDNKELSYRNKVIKQDEKIHRRTIVIMIISLLNICMIIFIFCYISKKRTGGDNI